MEKRGIIRPDVTPPQDTVKTDEKIATAEDQTKRIMELDNDFRLRAAETVVKAKKM
jgi:hypothetical protein